jgi:hypothetical protein
MVNPSRFYWLLLPLGLAFGVFGGTSCIQIGPDADDAGADAGSTAPVTVEAQCTTMMTEFCARAEYCYGADPNACLPPNLNVCCNHDCGVTATSTAAAVNQCVSDLEAASCDDIDVGTMPASCLVVPTY